MKRQLTYLEKRYDMIFPARPIWYEVIPYSNTPDTAALIVYKRYFKRGNYALNYAGKLISQGIYCEVQAICEDGQIVQVCAC